MSKILPCGVGGWSAQSFEVVDDQRNYMTELKQKRPVSFDGRTGQGDDKRAACVNHYSISGDRIEDLGEIDHSDDALGNTTIKVSTFEQCEIKANKWQLLRMVQDLLSNTSYRVLMCQKAIGQVRVMKSDQAYFEGVATCGSVWLCPVCNRRIAFERGELIRKATGAGFKMILLTATLQHTRRDQLADVLDALKLALRKLKQGRWWREFRDRWGVQAYVSSYEITFGHANGWHPHTHILIFLDDEIDIDVFWSELVSRYVHVVEKTGRYASKYHAVDAKKAGGSEVASYMTKWAGSDVAFEMTGSQNKKRGGLSFWELVASGESDLVHEYASATCGLKSLTWSHGAKELLGLNVADPEDVDRIDPELVADIPTDVWNVIRSRALQGFILELAVADPAGLRNYIFELDRGHA